MIQIRPANPNDAADILAILNPIISDTTITFAPDGARLADVVSGLASHADRGDPYIVAAEDGRVLGYAKYGPFRSGAGYLRTAEITVHMLPSVRGTGLGRQLVTHLESHARTAGKHSLIAGISAENEAGLAFHRKMGFAEVGRIPDAGHKFGRYIDLVLMQKFL